MRAKKKREVDPNAPPRPNLMSHDKIIRDQKLSIQQLNDKLNYMERRLQDAENKLRYQTEYLSSLHNRLSRK